MLSHKYAVEQPCMLPCGAAYDKLKSFKDMSLFRGWCLIPNVRYISNRFPHGTLYRLLSKSNAISETPKIPVIDNVTTLSPDYCPGWLGPFHDGFSTHSSESSTSFSMSDGNTISVVALSVALVALVIALGQLLGQYFATADGYRRCQSSVMGPWARYTRLSWRWRQFRFETYFTTPQIIFLPDGHDSGRSGRSGNSALSTQDTLMISNREGIDPCIRELFILNKDGGKDEEVVCWLSLLQSLFLNRWKLEQFGCYKRSVAPGRRYTICMSPHFGQAGCPVLYLGS